MSGRVGDAVFISLHPCYSKIKSFEDEKTINYYSIINAYFE